MAKHASSASKIVTLLVVILLGWIFWHFAPMFLPRYRWVHVRTDQIAKEATARGLPTTVAKLETQFDIVFGYMPRGKDDPRPWVLFRMNQPWHEFTGNPDDDETTLMKRCAIISDRTGEGISGYLLGSGQYKDRFYKAKAWRFPPGSLGFPEIRPVVMFEAMTLEKCDIGEAEVLSAASRDGRQWQPDDDEYEPGAAP